MKKRILLILALFLMLGNSARVAAECSISHGNPNDYAVIDKRAYQLVRLKAGNNIASSAPKDMGLIFCDSDSGGSYTVKFIGGGNLSNDPSFLDTGLDGIGLSWTATVGGEAINFTNGTFTSKTVTVAPGESGSGGIHPLQGFKYQYRAVGPGDPMPGNVTINPQIQIETDNGDQYTFVSLDGVSFIASCALYLSDTTMQIGDVPASALPAIGGLYTQQKGRISGYIYCDRDINVTASLVAENDPDAADVVPLSNAGQEGVARGVGVKVKLTQQMGNEEPYPNGDRLNQDIPLTGGEPTSGVTKNYFNIDASYYRTQQKVVAGKADAQLTLAIRYE